jgi:hypothetical protein
MTDRGSQIHRLICSCGKVELEIRGEPITAMTCNCDSCRQAGRQLEGLPNASPILSEEGGTPYVMFRKDRVRCISGEMLLDEYRLSPTTPTRRIVAACCNSAMFLDFTKGHWVSVYETRYLESNAASSLTSPKRGFLIPRLIWTWVTMGFKTPRFAFIKGQVHGAKSQMS